VGAQFPDDGSPSAGEPCNKPRFSGQRERSEPTRRAQSSANNFGHWLPMDHTTFLRGAWARSASERSRPQSEGSANIGCVRTGPTLDLARDAAARPLHVWPCSRLGSAVPPAGAALDVPAGVLLTVGLIALHTNTGEGSAAFGIHPVGLRADQRHRFHRRRGDAEAKPAPRHRPAARECAFWLRAPGPSQSPEVNRTQARPLQVLGSSAAREVAVSSARQTGM
jgi:hypothetical protein